jgi:hypothetical protein
MTNPTANPESRIAALRQQVTGLANPQSSLDAIGAEFGKLWDRADQANDAEAKHYLELTWQKAQELATSTSAAQAVANAALQTAVEIAGEHAQLVQAIQDPYFTEHPLVEELVQSVRDDLEEYLAYGAMYGGIMDETPGDTAAENGHIPDIPACDLDDFLHIVYGDSQELPDDMYRELAEFINIFIPAARETWLAHHTAKSEALRRDK